MRRLNQSGSHAVLVLALVVVLAVVGLAGYRVMQGSKTTDSTENTSKTVVPETISTGADLDQTSKALDQTANDLDSALDDTAFDADLESML